MFFLKWYFGDCRSVLCQQMLTKIANGHRDSFLQYVFSFLSCAKALCCQIELIGWRLTD